MRKPTVSIGTTRPFHLVHTGRELANYGAEVRVAGYMPKFKYKTYGGGQVQYTSLFAPSLPTSALALQRFSPRLQTVATELLLTSTDRLICKWLRPSDIYIGLSAMAVESLRKARELGCLAIADRGSSHVLNQAELLSNSTNRSITPRYIDRELASYEEADYVAVPSTFARDSFLERGFPRERLFLNMYGVNLERFSRRVRLSDRNKRLFKLLFVGGWGFRKGCDLFHGALEAYGDISLTHVGGRFDGAYPTNPRFRAVGHINNEDLQKIYHDHDALVLPSREDGFGMVMLEALSCDLPIICSKNTGGPDICSVLGAKHPMLELMEEVSSDSLATAINNLRKRVEASESQLCLEDAERQSISWRGYGKRYEEFLVSTGRYQRPA